jgi:transcriptional regulator with XRE-family HTH domain
MYPIGNAASIMRADRWDKMPARMETMGDRIKLLRVARGLSQGRLGQMCGVSEAAVSKWENGSTANIRLPTFMCLCESLHTDPAYLIYGASRSGNARATGNNHK